MTNKRASPRDLTAVIVGMVLFVVLGASSIFACRVIGLFWLLDMLSRRTPAQQATLTAVSPLTTSYGEEARTALETYNAVSGSHYAELHREALATVVTHPWLDRLMEWEGPQRDDLIWVTRDFVILNLNMLEYTPERMRFFACTLAHIDVLTIQGEYVRSLPQQQGQTFYAFVREEAVWKLATAFGFWERDDALRDWAYVSDEERQLLGDVPGYIDLRFGCGYP